MNARRRFDIVYVCSALRSSDETESQLNERFTVHLKQGDQGIKLWIQAGMRYFSEEMHAQLHRMLVAVSDAGSDFSASVHSYGFSMSLSMQLCRDDWFCQGHPQGRKETDG